MENDKTPGLAVSSITMMKRRLDTVYCCYYVFAYRLDHNTIHTLARSVLEDAVARSAGTK